MCNIINQARKYTNGCDEISVGVVRRSFLIRMIKLLMSCDSSSAVCFGRMLSSRLRCNAMMRMMMMITGNKLNQQIIAGQVKHFH